MAPFLRRAGVCTRQHTWESLSTSHTLAMSRAYPLNVKHYELSQFYFITMRNLNILCSSNIFDEVQPSMHAYLNLGYAIAVTLVITRATLIITCCISILITLSTPYHPVPCLYRYPLVCVMILVSTTTPRYLVDISASSARMCDHDGVALHQVF